MFCQCIHPAPPKKPQLNCFLFQEIRGVDPSIKLFNGGYPFHIRSLHDGTKRLNCSFSRGVFYITEKITVANGYVKKLRWAHWCIYLYIHHVDYDPEETTSPLQACKFCLISIIKPCWDGKLSPWHQSSGLPSLSSGWPSGWACWAQRERDAWRNGSVSANISMLFV